MVYRNIYTENVYTKVQAARLLSLCNVRRQTIILEIAIARLLNTILPLNTRWFSEFHLFGGPRQLVFVFYVGIVELSRLFSGIGRSADVEPVLLSRSLNV